MSHRTTTPTGTDIQIRGLAKAFKKFTAVDDLTFEVQPGRITGFLGPNGAGKTTTLRMLLGLVKPTAGEGLIGGKRYAELASPLNVVGPRWRPPTFTPAVVGAITSGCLPPPTKSLIAGSTSCWSWSAYPPPRANVLGATRWVCGNGSGWPVPCSETRRF